jgi:hypothetical protein
MTISLEKIFFKYILVNKKYIYKVEPSYFKNPEINMIYNQVHKYMLENTDADMPKPAQIFEMVSLIDKEKKITKRNFKLLIQTDLNEYDEEKFIKPKLKAWILMERISDSSNYLIDKTRDLENGELTLERVEEIAGSIREEIQKNTTSNFDDDDDLGSDFENPETHVQDHSTMKVRTDWASVDSMLGGGLDVKTLNILMGQTNSGKCSYNSYIYIRNKITGDKNKVLINTFFNMQKAIKNQ